MAIQLELLSGWILDQNTILERVLYLIFFTIPKIATTVPRIVTIGPLDGADLLIQIPSVYSVEEVIGLLVLPGLHANGVIIKQAEHFRHRLGVFELQCLCEALAINSEVGTDQFHDIRLFGRKNCYVW